MKKYGKKIILIVLLMAVYITVSSFNLKGKTTELMNSISLDNKEATVATCSTNALGAGKTYYVDMTRMGSSGTNILSSPSYNSYTSTYVSQCTEVTVYCQVTNGGQTYYKISKANEKYLQKDYLTDTKPMSCFGDVPTTSKERITFNHSNTYTTNASGFDQMYANKNGTITVVLNNLANVAKGDEDKFNVAITGPSNNTVSQYTVTKSLNVSARTLTLTIKMNSADKSYSEWRKGQHNIRVYSEDHSINTNFYLVGNYYNYTASIAPVANSWGGFFANYANSWKITLANVENIEFGSDCNLGNAGSKSTCNFSFQVLKDGRDYTSKFNITGNSTEKTFTVVNRTGLYVPKSGNYQVIISYRNDSYSDSRGTITYNLNNGLVISKKKMDFKSTSVDPLVLYRYTRENKTEPKDLKIAYVITNADESVTVKYYEDTDFSLTTKSLLDFRTMYTAYDPTDVIVAENGQVICVNGGVTIVNYLNGNITYQDSEGNTITESEETFVEKYQDAYDYLMENYEFAVNGQLLFKTNQLKTYEALLTEPEPAKSILAGVGGEFRFHYNYSNISDSDFRSADIKIYTRDGALADSNVFRVKNWTHADGNSEVIVEYSGQDIKYEGFYYISINFDDAEEIKTVFSVYAGQVDYYLTSSVNDHRGDLEDQLETMSPPGNKKYEQNIGFYLIQGGAQLDKKSKENIKVHIYDHLVEKDEHGKLVFYNQETYQVVINKIYNVDGEDLIDYQVVNRVGDDNIRSEMVTDKLTDFDKKYHEAYTYIDYLVFDASGKVINDKYAQTDKNGNSTIIHVKRYYNVAEEDTMYIDYTVGSSSTVIKENQTNFKMKYPQIFGLIETRFIQEADNSFMLGGIVGNNKYYEDEDGNPIKGNLLYSTGSYEKNFNVVIDETPENVKAAIQITPITEVDAGKYYVYVDYDTLNGVGYKNTQEFWADDEPPLSENQFPEMWGQNTHMTTITYIEPEYDFEIKDPVVTNTGNDLDKMYNNISGSVKYTIKPKYIYDFKGFSYKIEKCSSETCEGEDVTWDDVTEQEYFTVDNSLDPTSPLFDKDDCYMTLHRTSKAGTGIYRYTLYYENKGSTAVKSATFTIGNEYYGLSIENAQPIEFVHNYTPSQMESVLAKGSYISKAQAEDIEISLERVIVGADNIKYHIDGDTFYYEDNGERIDSFKFKKIIDEDYYDNENEILYRLDLTNIVNQAPIGNYDLVFTYKTATGDTATTKMSFKVLTDKFEYVVDDSNPKAVADDDLMQIQYPFTTKYINKEKLDSFIYKVYYSGESMEGEYKVVNGEGENDFFTVTASFKEEENEYDEYEGTLYITFRDKDIVDLDGHYYFTVDYPEDDSKNKLDEHEYEVGNLREIFTWNISKFEIKGVFDSSDVDDDGNPINEEVELDGFYNNVDKTNLILDVKTVHRNKVKWKIYKYDEVINKSFDPTVGSGYNSFFNEVTNDTENGGKLEIELNAGDRLNIGDYAIVLYYSSTDYLISRFKVQSEFASINFGASQIYSVINSSKTVNDLYLTNNGKIVTKLKVIGIPYSSVNISINDLNGVIDYVANGTFNLNETKLRNDKIVDLTFDKAEALKNGMEPGKYQLIASYKTQDGKPIISTLTFDVYKTYFNFTFDSPQYNPNPIVPNGPSIKENSDEKGTITFKVITETIKDYYSLEDVRDTFADNAIIYNNRNEVVYNKKTNVGTDLFELSTTSAKDEYGAYSYSMFNLLVKIKGTDEQYVEPGFYHIETDFTLDGKKISNGQEFEIGALSKSLKITRVEMVTPTNDGKIHRNIGGTYKLFYISPYAINQNNIDIKVQDKSGNEVNKFTVSYEQNCILLTLDANIPYIDAGKYDVVIEYSEDGNKATLTQEIVVSGIYKYIEINDINVTDGPIYSDKETGYYTFKVNESIVDVSDLSKFEVRVYDAEDNIVYSTITDEKNIDSLDITNRLDTANDDFKISFKPFKLRKGEYEVTLLLLNEDNEYNESNRLKFTVDENFYKVDITKDSYIRQTKTYNNDKISIYDVDNSEAYYKFTTTYDTTDLSKYSIKIYNGLKLVEELPIKFNKYVDTNELVEYVESGFMIDPLNNDGKYDFAVCINGLPYTWITKDINKFIPLKSAKLKIASLEIKDGSITSLYDDRDYKLSVVVEPSNATDKGFTYSLLDNSFGTITGNVLRPLTASTTTLVATNTNGYTIRATVKVTKKLTSNLYKIDYTNNTIYIDSMKTNSLERSKFLNKLIYAGDIKIMKGSENVTNKAGTVTIGTGYKVINGGVTFTVILIGDVTGDGKINLGDVAKLYQYYRKSIKITDKNIIKAGRIRKANAINLADIAKLYQFVRGSITKI